MQKYLDQLISDMQMIGEKAKANLIPDEVFDPVKMMELEESPEQTMGFWFGLSQENFPASDRLNEQQLDQMAIEFEELWGAFGFYPDFPDKLPSKLKYELMREYLNEPCQYWAKGWAFHFEFCHYNPDECPFGSEFCRCKEYQ